MSKTNTAVMKTTATARRVRARPGVDRPRQRGGRVARSAAATLVLAASAAGLAGCFAKPESAASAGFNSRDAVTKASGAYWERSGPLSAALPAHGRVAIEAFDVEFATSSSELPFDGQLVFTPPPFSPIGLGISTGVGVSGISRKSPAYAAGALRRTTDDLYAAFVADLVRRGLTVVRPAEVTAAPAYARLARRPSLDSSPLQYLQVVFSSDTGRAEATRTLPASGLAVVTGPGGDRRAEVDESVRRQTGADAVVAVTLVVTPYRGRAALGRGSSITIATAEHRWTLNATRSLLSDGKVVSASSWAPVVGEQPVIQTEAFGRELGRLLPTYIALALGEPDRAPGARPFAATRPIETPAAVADGR